MYRNFSNKRKYQSAGKVMNPVLTALDEKMQQSSIGDIPIADVNITEPQLNISDNYTITRSDLSPSAQQDPFVAEYLAQQEAAFNPSERPQRATETTTAAMDSEIDTPSNLNEKQQEKLDKLREKLSNVEAGKGKGIQDLLDFGTVGGISQMLTDLPERSLYMAGLQSTEGARGKGRALFNVLQAGISAAGSGLMGYAGGKAGEGAPSTTQVTEESSTESPDDMVFVQGADGKYRQIRRGDIVTTEETTEETTEKFAMGGRVPLVRNQDNQAAILPSPSLATANPITVDENLLQPVSLNPAASFDVFQPFPSTVSLPASMQQIGPQAFSTPDMKPMVDFTTDTDGDGIPDYLDQSDDSITTEPVTEEEEEKTRATKLAELLALGQQASTFGDITSTAGLTGYLGSQIDENPLLGTLGTVAGTGSTLFKGARSFLGGQSYGRAMAGDDARARQRRRQMLITSPTMGEEIAQLDSYLQTDRGDARALDGTKIKRKKYAGGGITIPLDSRGLFRHPNRVVDVPLSKGKTITMKDQKGKPNLPEAILAIPDGDSPTVIFRGQDKKFPNSDFVREIPLNQALYG